MSFKKIVDKFDAVAEDLKKVGDQIVEAYPNSKTLQEMVMELTVAKDALNTLKEQISEALVVAEKDEGLKKELSEKIKESELYSELTPEDKEKIAEYLVQTKQDLATKEMLDAYVEKSLAQKPASDLIAMIPKANIIKKGKELDDGSDGFDAYATGFAALQKEFNSDKFSAVKQLVPIWFEKGIAAVLKEFYQAAFKESEGVTDGD